MLEQGTNPFRHRGPPSHSSSRRAANVQLRRNDVKTANTYDGPKGGGSTAWEASATQGNLGLDGRALGETVEQRCGEPSRNPDRNRRAVRALAELHRRQELRAIVADPARFSELVRDEAALLLGRMYSPDSDQG